jgi:hypothetical protein
MASDTPSKSPRVVAGFDYVTTEPSLSTGEAHGQSSTTQGDNIHLTSHQLSASQPSAGQFDQRISRSAATSHHRNSHESVRSTSLTPAQSHFISRSRSRSPGNQSLSNRGVETLSLPGAYGDVAGFLDEYVPPVSTSRCLQQFRDVVRRTVDPKIEAERAAKIKFYKAERAKQAKILRKLRLWASSKDKKAISNILRGLFALKSDFPSQKEVIDLAKYHYPPRGHVPVIICDFGDDKFETKEIKLGEIESRKASAHPLSPKYCLLSRYACKTGLVPCPMAVGTSCAISKENTKAFSHVPLGVGIVQSVSLARVPSISLDRVVCPG